jgi:hypothetical protein
MSDSLEITGIRLGLSVRGGNGWMELREGTLRRRERERVPEVKDEHRMNHREPTPAVAGMGHTAGGPAVR